MALPIEEIKEGEVYVFEDYCPQKFIARVKAIIRGSEKSKIKRYDGTGVWDKEALEDFIDDDSYLVALEDAEGEYEEGRDEDVDTSYDIYGSVVWVYDGSGVEAIKKATPVGDSDDEWSDDVKDFKKVENTGACRQFQDYACNIFTGIVLKVVDANHIADIERYDRTGALSDVRDWLDEDGYLVAIEVVDDSDGYDKGERFVWSLGRDGVVIRKNGKIIVESVKKNIETKKGDDAEKVARESVAGFFKNEKGVKVGQPIHRVVNKEDDGSELYLEFELAHEVYQECGKSTSKMEEDLADYIQQTFQKYNTGFRSFEVNLYLKEYDQFVELSLHRDALNESTKKVASRNLKEDVYDDVERLGHAGSATALIDDGWEPPEEGEMRDRRAAVARWKDEHGNKTDIDAANEMYAYEELYNTDRTAYDFATGYGHTEFILESRSPKEIFEEMLDELKTDGVVKGNYGSEIKTEEEIVYNVIELAEDAVWEASGDHEISDLLNHLKKAEGKGFEDIDKGIRILRQWIEEIKAIAEEYSVDVPRYLKETRRARRQNHLKEAGRSLDAIYQNQAYNSTTAANKVMKRQGLERDYLFGPKERNGGFETSRVYRDRKSGVKYGRKDGAYSAINGETDPAVIDKIADAEKTFAKGRRYSYEKEPPMGHKALMGRYKERKNLIQILGSELFHKYKFSDFDDDVTMHEEDFRDGSAEHILEMEDAGIVAVDPANPNNVIYFYAEDFKGYIEEHTTYYAPAHLTADPYYSSPEEWETEYGRAECTDGEVKWEVEGEDFMDDTDKKAIAEALGDYFQSCIETYEP